MAPCLPLLSCFPCCSAKTRQNDAPNRYAVNGRRRGSSQTRFDSAQSAPVSQKDAHFRRFLLGKRKVEETEDQAGPEPCDKLPEGVPKHWAPESRSCEEVLQEIQLAAPANSQVSLEKVEKVVDENENRKLLTRFRKLIVKERTPEGLEMLALRKEKKAVIKYLKAEGLYTRRMTYEHMKDLKNVVERSQESEQQERDVQEIEMKEMKSAAPKPKPAEVEKAEPPVA